MKRALIAAFVLLSCVRGTFAKEPVVRLSLSPAQTLPGLPVSMLLTVTNRNSEPLELSTHVEATVTNASGEVFGEEVTLPARFWLGETSPGSSFTVASGTTVERLMPVDAWLIENPLFIAPGLGLGRPGEYDIVLGHHPVEGRQGGRPVECGASERAAAG
jgi:hypothetical protein